MKSILIYIKNLIPYLILISTYFFFVNIEAKHDKTQTNNSNDKNIHYKTKQHESYGNYKNTRISIPVIPYSE